MYYISAASTISHQPTFKNMGFSSSLKPLQSSSDLISPNFKEYINPSLIRRMTEILRTSVTCSTNCLSQANLQQPDAIIVGTGLGCLKDTEKFLKEYTSGNEGMISPTSFIQSTHNTIGGQISLILGNHSYNMTHTQNTLSFEHAIIDAVLNLDEGKNNVLVGAADEHIEVLDAISGELGFTNLHLASGASFFVLTNEKSSGTQAKISDVFTFGAIHDFALSLKSFLSQNESITPDMVLFSSLSEINVKELENCFPGKPILNYCKYSGIYFSNSGFALHLAIDILQNKEGVNKILICNNLNKNSLGLTIVEKP